MTKALVEIKNIIEEQAGISNSYKRNVLRNYLQVFILHFIYSDKAYSDLIFYGGSVLSQCYRLPRSSENLDFIDLKGRVNIDKLSRDIEAYFKKETGLPIVTKTQKFRVYLKFPILRQLGIANDSQSDWLHLKVEIFNGSGFCKKYKTEIKPLFKFNQSVIIKTFDLPTLMATKINAVLNRKWKKIDKTGKVLISVKGRDYFDLMWYLQNNIKPNMSCVEGVTSIIDLQTKLLEIVSSLDTRSIVLDLENFIADQGFAKKLGRNIREILTIEINRLN